MVSLIRKVIDNTETTLEKQYSLIALKRKDLKKAVYTGAVALGLSIPIAIMDYVPLINNYVKNKDLNPRVLGEIGILVSTNVIINSIIRSFEHSRDMKELEKLITKIKRSDLNPEKTPLIRSKRRVYTTKQDIKFRN